MEVYQIYLSRHLNFSTIHLSCSASNISKLGRYYQQNFEVLYNIPHMHLSLLLFLSSFILLHLTPQNANT